jgi:hypothetical protein
MFKREDVRFRKGLYVDRGLIEISAELHTKCGQVVEDNVTPDTQQNVEKLMYTRIWYHLYGDLHTQLHGLRRELLEAVPFSKHEEFSRKYEAILDSIKPEAM